MGENSWWKALLQLAQSEAASGWQMSELRYKSFPPPLYFLSPVPRLQWASHTIPDSLLNAALGPRTVYHSLFWYLPVKRKCLPYRTGFNCVLLPLSSSIICLLCSSDSLWEEKPCCQPSIVKLCGFFIPASGTMRITAKTEAALLKIPWFYQSQANISKDFSKSIFYTLKL